MIHQNQLTLANGDPGRSELVRGGKLAGFSIKFEVFYRRSIKANEKSTSSSFLAIHFCPEQLQADRYCFLGDVIRSHPGFWPNNDTFGFETPDRPMAAG
jgi:hypothetical protein